MSDAESQEPDKKSEETNLESAGNNETQQQADEVVAITGSPNTVNEIAFDVMHTHLQTPLLGALVKLNVPVRTREGLAQLLALAQVTKIETTNRWHEDPSLKNYIKLRGILPHLTEVGDVTQGILQVLGAYRIPEDASTNTYKKLLLPIPPGSGIPINLVDAQLIHNLMRNDTGYGYIGYFYGGDNVPAPAYIRHFGDSDQEGSGEAYMGAAIGPSGCGKSIIAAMLIALWSHHPQMGIMIIDPASEFSRNAFAAGTSYDFDFFDVLTKFSNNRFTKKNIITLDKLQLEGTTLFVSLLEQKKFFNHLGLTDSKKRSDAMHTIQQLLEDLKDKKLWHTQMDWQKANTIQIQGASLFQSFQDLFISEIARVYAASNRQGKIAEFQHAWNTSQRHLERAWNNTVTFFLPTTPAGQPRANLNNIVQAVMENAGIYIIDINPELHKLGETFKTMLMDFIFKQLRRRSHKLYSLKKPANCLIVMDEAGRFIPQDPGDNETLRSLTKTLTDSVKELRKYRCGFFFINQNIAEIQKDIYRNLHYRIYGVGLGVGVDADHIKNKEGEDAYELYRSLPEPRLSKSFSFMIAGVLLALGSSGKPMIISGFPGGSTLLLENKHILSPDDFEGLGNTPT